MIDKTKLDWNELKNYSIFPLADKYPVSGFKWQKYQTQPPTKEEIDNWLEDERFDNIAVVLGDYIHTLVVDLDIREDGRYDKIIEDKLPNTLIKKSKNGGYHFYYKYPSNLSFPQKIGFDYKVDVKASGSYVVYYKNDTTHPKFQNEVAQAPQWLLDELKNKSKKNTKNTMNTMSEEKIIPVNDYINKGERNSIIISKIGKLLIKTNPDLWENLWDVFVDYNNTLCNPPIEEKELRITFDCLCNAEREKNTLTFTTMSTQEILNKTEKNNPFLLYGMIVDGALNILTSESGKGKSVDMLKMVDSISTGNDFLGVLKTKKTKTLVIDLEMSENDLIQRTHSIIQKANENLRFLRLRKFDIEKDFDSLKKTILTENYKFVVFDTFSHIHRRRENDNDDMTRVMEKLEDLTELGITVLLLHHNRKPGIKDRYDSSSLRGAVAILGAQASCLMLDSTEKLIEYEGKQHKGLNISIKQEKNRQVQKMEPFTMDCFYDEETKKTTFIYIKGDKNMSMAEKIEQNIIDKMEKGKEYFVEDLMGNNQKNSTTNALKKLIANKKINFRTPSKGEKFGGKSKNARTHIYFLN